VSGDALARFRASFSKTPWAMLNNAGVSPCSQPSIDAMKAAAERMALGGPAIPDEIRDHERARESFARLVGAKAENTSMMQTCAAAISQVALGMTMSAGDEVVTWDQEYPSNAYPWYAATRRAGGSVVVVPSNDDLSVDTGRLIDAITDRTRAVAISWVQYQSGAITDLKAVGEACKQHDAFFFVDAIQGLGVLPFDLEELGVDALAGGTHKWLCGPLGHGFLAFADGRRDEIEPLMHGAVTYASPDDLTDPELRPKSDPRRFEPGTPLLLGTLGGAAAIDIVLDAGVETLGDEARRLARRLTDKAQEKGARLVGSGDSLSPIRTLVPREDLDVVAARLDAAKVAYGLRAGGVRLAAHAHNSEDDIDRAIAAL
jgi:selenocysteine lyase/cysteine desulfurase